MRSRQLALSALLVLLLPALGVGGAAVYQPIEEQLVEGHTVWATIDVVQEEASRAEFAAAVAILVHEDHRKSTHTRFPGVLWFNDQYLIEPSAGRGGSSNRRMPCTGAILAVNEGDPDPRLMGPSAFNALTYVESYLITDPNDHSWNIDRWTIDGRPVWTVAILDNQAGYSQPDNGTCRGGSYGDRSCNAELTADDTYCRFGGAAAGRGPMPGAARASPGAHGMGYPCQGCPGLEYNALLYFYLEDLDVAGVPKNHRDGSADRQNDASGCQSPTSPNAQRNWPCPGGDDDREGNSHPYNPDDYWFAKNYDGWMNHGGSDDCSGDATFDMDCHATRMVDIYYGVAAEPPGRKYREGAVDVQGHSAPYHCHGEYDDCFGPGTVRHAEDELDEDGVS